MIAVGTHTGNAFVLSAEDFSYKKTVRLSDEAEAEIIEDSTSTEETKVLQLPQSPHKLIPFVMLSSQGHFELPKTHATDAKDDESEDVVLPPSGSASWPQQPMVTCVSIPDKDTLFVGDSKGMLRVYQLTSGEALRVFNIHEEMQRLLSATSDTLKKGGKDAKEKNKNATANGGQVTHATVCVAPVQGGAMAPCVVAGLERGSVVVIDLRGGEALMALETHTGLCYLGFIRSAQFLV